MRTLLSSCLSKCLYQEAYSRLYFSFSTLSVHCYLTRWLLSIFFSTLDWYSVKLTLRHYEADGMYTGISIWENPSASETHSHPNRTRFSFHHHTTRIFPEQPKPSVCPSMVCRLLGVNLSRLEIALRLTRTATGESPEVAPWKDYALALPAHGIVSLIAGRSFSNY